MEAGARVHGVNDLDVVDAWWRAANYDSPFTTGRPVVFAVWPY